jgi:hypothetical protein
MFVPILIGDGNAIDALISSIGLTGIVVVSYYLRMVGRYRAQIALGGIGLGVGISLAVSAILNIANPAINIVSFVPNYMQLVFAVILIGTGYFNLNAHTKIREDSEGQSEGLRSRLAKLLKFFT